MLKKSPLLSLLLILLTSACASKGFNRGALQDQIGVVREVEDPEIRKILKRKPNLPKPFKLGVYFKQPHQKDESKAKWRWTEQDKNLILEAAKDFENDGTISQVFPILSSMIAKENERSIRVAAATHGADAVLVIDGAGEIDKYINGWGWSYILLLPAFFVPGTEADTLFLANAAMWDVGNDFLYLTAEAEGQASNTRSVAFGKKDEILFEEAKTVALQNLKTEIVKMMKGKK